MIKKTITYRIGAILITIITCIILGVDIGISSAVAILVEILHSFYYYLHETLWNKFEKKQDMFKELVRKVITENKEVFIN